MSCLVRPSVRARAFVYLHILMLSPCVTRVRVSSCGPRCVWLRVCMRTCVCACVRASVFVACARVFVYVVWTWLCVFAKQACLMSTFVTVPICACACAFVLAYLPQYVRSLCVCVSICVFLCAGPYLRRLLHWPRCEGCAVCAGPHDSSQQMGGRTATTHATGGNRSQGQVSVCISVSLSLCFSLSLCLSLYLNSARSNCWACVHVSGTHA